MLLPLVLPRLVRQVVGERLGIRPCRMHLIACNAKHWVFEADLGGEKVVIVKASPQREGRLVVEAWAHHCLSALGVPVPAVLAVEDHPSVLGAYLITTRCEGVPLPKAQLDSRKRERALIETGRYLRSIHAVVLAGYGTVDETRLACEGLPVGQHRSWREALHYWFEPLPTLLDEHALDARTVRRVEEVLQRFAHFLDADRSVLLHGDFKQDHVFVDIATGSVSGIIDLEVLIGDPVWDLAWFGALSEDPADGEALLRAYAEPSEGLWADVRLKAAFYVVIRSIGSAAWFLEKGFVEKTTKRLGLLRSQLSVLEAA